MYGTVGHRGNHGLRYLPAHDYAWELYRAPLNQRRPRVVKMPMLIVPEASLAAFTSRSLTFLHLRHSRAFSFRNTAATDVGRYDCRVACIPAPRA